jgi:hypothetical protein
LIIKSVFFLLLVLILPEVESEGVFYYPDLESEKIHSGKSRIVVLVLQEVSSCDMSLLYAKNFLAEGLCGYK